MKTIASYKQDIRFAILAEPEVVPNRIGATPISDLANTFSKLGSEKEHKKALLAIKYYIENPQELVFGVDAKEYWRNLIYLLRHVNNENDKKTLQPIFHQKLFDNSFREQQLNVWFLHGLVASGGVITVEELNHEILLEIREYAPIAWLGTAVVSGQFALAHRSAIELLEQNKIDRSRLVFALLTQWQYIWEESVGREAFALMVKEFYNAMLPFMEDNELITERLRKFL